MPYAYQGDNCYGRGDYYQGDYYRGDPGLFGSIGKALGGLAKGVLRVGAAAVGASPIGQVVKAAGTLLAPPGQQLMPGGGGGVGIGYFDPRGGGVGVGYFGPGSPQVPQQPTGTLTPGGQFLPGLCNVKGTHPNKTSYYRAVPGNPMQGILIPKGSVCVTTRRLNVANPRALRRGIRRVAGFAKLARRSIRWVSAKPPKGRPVAKRGR